jgi:hypothetical protein
VPSASLAASASPAPTAAGSRCSAPFAGTSFTLGERATTGSDPGEDDDDGSDDPSLPFAVEVGSAVAWRDGFAVAALDTKAGVTKAVVAFVDADAKKGRVAELGKLHGDPDPPELAALDGSVVALMHDTDAGGELLRLVSLRPGEDKIDVVLGAEIAESRDESRVAHLALGPERGLAVWDEWNKTDRHGVIRACSFSNKDVSNVTRPRTISAADEDAEGPRLARRTGGFWAAWISAPIKGKTKPIAPPKKPDKPAPAASAAPEPDVPPLELGPRALRIVALDANGVPHGQPVDVTAKDAHVIAFDLEAGPDDTALLTWRDDTAAPGAEERSVRLARVKADGSVERSTIFDEQVGAGVPLLLVDASPKEREAPTLWLSLDSVNDATRIGALSASGALLDVLGTEPAIRSGEPLAIARGRILVAKPRGLAVELSVVECKPGAPAPASP